MTEKRETYALIPDGEEYRITAGGTVVGHVRKHGNRIDIAPPIWVAKIGAAVERARTADTAFLAVVHTLGGDVAKSEPATKPGQPAIVRTASGRGFDVAAPRAADVDWRDIATALGQQCRFNGHTLRFYSVAQHCCLVQLAAFEAERPADRTAAAELGLAALLHDAAEAYVGDLATQVKRLVPDFDGIEAGVRRAIFEAAGLPHSLPAAVHKADLVACATEARDLMAPSLATDSLDLLDVDPLPGAITPLAAEAAARMWLSTFYALESTRRAERRQTRLH